jgi:hypothetical protein
MAKVLASEVLVDCKCWPSLALPVLRAEIRANCNVTACMRCGEVSATVAIVDEPYPHDTHHVGNSVYDLTVEARDWLAQFPRCTKGSGRGRERIFLSAEVRASTEADLRKLEDAACEQQRGLDFASRLRIAGVPNAPAPPLVDWLKDFSCVAAAIALTPDASLNTIAFHMAALGDQALLGADVFEQRPRYRFELAALLNERDREMQLAAHVFIRDRRFWDTEFIKIFERQLAGPEPPVGFGVLLSTFYILGTLARPLVPALRNKAKLTSDTSDGEYLLRIATILEGDA